MNTKIKKWFLKSSIFAGLFSAIGLVVYFKVQTPFKPVVYNYESYISKTGKERIDQDFNYREFGDLSEFTRAIEDNRTIAGVGSDFQIARLVQKKLLQKINYAKLFPNWDVASAFKIPDNYSTLTKEAKQEFIDKKRAAFVKMFRPEIVAHIDKYDKYMHDDQGKPIDVDHDGIPDRFWEFFIPYYTQDKVMAYTIGDYEVDGKDKNGYDIKVRKNMRKFMDNWSPEEKKEIQEKGIQFNDQSLAGIGAALRKHGYKYFEWTESMFDNLLIGTEKLNEYGTEINEKNYKQIVDAFINYIGTISGHPYTDLKHNVFKTSGLELANSVIDPSLNQDVGLLYNGDALDANFSKDNYEILEEENTIRIIRPKNNLTLLDGWVILASTPEDTTNKLYHTLYESIFKGEDFTLDEMLKHTAVETKYNWKLNDETEKYEKQSGQGYSFDFSSVPSMENFDYINYTPTFQKSYDFFRKFYFNDDVATVKENEDGDEIYLLLNKDSQIITNPDDLTFDKVLANASDPKTLKSLNMYLTQQPEQTLRGNLPTEDNKDEGRYSLTYTFLKPIDEHLLSLIRTYYTLKTKH